MATASAKAGVARGRLTGRSAPSVCQGNRSPPSGPVTAPGPRHSTGDARAGHRLDLGLTARWSLTGPETHEDLAHDGPTHRGRCDRGAQAREPNCIRWGGP